MKIILSGIKGAMGQNVIRCASGKAEIVGGVDTVADGTEVIPTVTSFQDSTTDADVIIDFSHHSATKNLLDFAVKSGLPVVLATTGQTPEELDMIKNASSRIPIFFAANYSVGVATLIKVAKLTAAALPDAQIEIVETHHNRKIDAPSGTALAIANALTQVRPDSNIVCGRSGYGKREPNDIGINSVRIGNIVGIHEVIIGTNTQTITLKHEAHDRAVFADGAIDAAKFIIGKPAGLYDMDSLLGQEDI